MHSFYSRLTPRKTSLSECWCGYKKKVCFYHPFWYEERKEKGNHEPLVSLRRPGSAEQAQFFSVFRSKGGKCEASARVSHAREEECKKKKATKKYLYHYAHQDRKTTKNILRIMNSQVGPGNWYACWKIFDYHMIFTNQFNRNSGSMESIFFFFALFSRAHLTLVSVRQWDAKKLRLFCKQDKASCNIVSNRLSIRKTFLNIELSS